MQRRNRFNTAPEESHVPVSPPPGRPTRPRAALDPRTRARALTPGHGPAHRVHSNTYNRRASRPNRASDSPRLLSLITSGAEPRGASLLPPTVPSTTEPEDRFCSGPKITVLGAVARTANNGPENLTFVELVARLEASLNQASSLLSERLKSFETKCSLAELTHDQEAEICQIADGFAAASYHVQKWAALLKSASSEQCSLPAKPFPTESVEDARATLHIAMPRLMVNGSEAQRLLHEAVREHSERAEAHVLQLGVHVEDLRAVGPHLERFLLRLARLNSGVRAFGRRDFILDFFTPAIGISAAKTVAAFL